VRTQKELIAQPNSLLTGDAFDLATSREQPAFPLLRDCFVGLAGLEPAPSSLSGIEG
jgi:hypothetical protein